MAKKERKNLSLLKTSILLLLIIVMAGGFLFSKTGREIISNLSLAGFLQNEQIEPEPQETQHNEQPLPNNSTEPQESATEPEPVQQAQPEQESKTQYPGAVQKQEQEKKEDLSKVITAGLVRHAPKQIALTFDAGWLYENTNAILNMLDQYNVKATFFVRGLWVKEHPDLASEIAKKGHSLENHSLTHGHMTTMTDAEIKDELCRTADIIRETTGYQTHLFRPPYGEYDNRMLRILSEEGYPYTILWTVDSHDWAEELNGVKITKDYLVNRIMSKASDNGIILMHVGGYETIHALPEIITGLRSKGYELIKVTDML
jgi:peptidoglycan/xylan/chitin deacetylase (PgdA/CDA1 family)